MLASVIAAALVSATPVPAHIYRSDGSWTYRYLTRHQNATSDCINGVGSIDPLNVIFYQYGDYIRIDSHISSETHWGHFSSAFYDPQSICGSTDTSPTYYDQMRNSYNEEEGHGSIATNTFRAHLRLFYAPHPHGSIVDKWSTVDAHHETLVCCFTHVIDEPWDTWEYHLAGEMPAHNQFYDYYNRNAGQYLQGYWDNGWITRVGGLHNGTY